MGVPILLVLLAFFQFAEASIANPKQDHAAFRFMENKGQVKDQNEQPRNDIAFLAVFNSYKVGFHNKGWSYEKDELASDTGRSKVFINRVDFTFLNREGVDVTYIGHNASPYYKNFFNHNIGRGGLHGVRDYRSLTSEQLYNGIDASFNEQDGKLKYEFRVAPNGSWSDIAIRIDGGSELRIDDQGDLIIKTPLGDFVERRPMAYYLDDNDRSVEVEVSFKLNGNVLSFELGDYPEERTLIIDPYVEWGTYYGGTRQDSPEAIEVDHDNNTIIAGRAWSRDLYITAGAFQMEHSQYNFDAFMAKFDTDGQLIWSTYMGDQNDEFIHSIVCDTDNNIYFAGIVFSEIGLTTPGTFLSNQNGGPIVVKFSPNGSLIWGTYADSGGRAWDVDLDHEGNLLVAGGHSAAGPLATPGTHQTTNAGSSDGFILRLTSVDGQKIWGTYYGGPESERATCIVGDSEGNIYVGGWGRSNSGIATPGALIESYDPWIIDGAFHLLKFTSEGQRIWGTYYGCRHDGRTDGLAIYQDSIIYLYGGSSCNTDIATEGTYMPDDPGGYARSVARFDQNGGLVWGTYLISDPNNLGNEIDVDSQGNLVISGWSPGFYSPSPATQDAVQDSAAGPPNQNWYNGYVMIMNPNGQKVFGTYLGGIDKCGTDLVSFDRDENIIAVGSSIGVDAVATPGAWQPENADPGESDAILIKINRDCDHSFQFNISGPTAVCPGAKDLMFTADTVLNTIYWELPYGSRITEHNGDTVIFDLGVVPGWVVAHQQSGCRTAPQDSVYISLTTDYPNVNIHPDSSFCDGDGVLFYTANQHQSNLTWSFADQTTYSTDSVAKVASTALDGYVYLEAEHDGCYQYDSIPFQVLDSPVFAVTGDTIACIGEQITLGVQGTYDVVEWNGVVGGQNHTVELLQDTVIDIRVSITGGCGLVESRALTAVPVPVPEITGINEVCIGDTTVLYASGNGEYLWNTSEITDSIVVHPTTSTQYSLEVDNGYCSEQSGYLVLVDQLPNVGIVGNAGHCLGDSITLIATGAESYTWSTGDPGSDLTVFTSGDFTVTGVDSNGCRSISASHEVLEYALPDNQLSLSGPTTFCSGNNVHISVPTGYQYNWQGISSSSSSVTVTSSGSYSVVITSGNNCISYSDTVDVTVFPVPNANIGHVGALTFCVGDSMVLTGLPASGVTYLWTNGSTQPNITVFQSGSYGLTVTNGNGCEDTHSPVQVHVNPLPNLDVTAIGNTSVCAGQTVDLTASSTGQIIWSNGQSGEDIVVSESGSYSATATSQQGCLAYSDTVDVLILPLPVVTINFPYDTLLTSDSLFNVYPFGSPFGGVFYLDGELSSEIDPTQMEVGDHILTYVYSGAEGCVDSAATAFRLEDGCTEHPEKAIESVKLSPNPTSQLLYLEFEESVCEMSGITALIYSNSGAVIATLPIVSKVVGWNVSSLDAGVYFLELRSGSTSVVKGFVKI